MKLALISLFCALGGCAAQTPSTALERPTAWAVPVAPLSGLPNLYRVTPGIYRAAQPLKEGFAYLDQQHPLESGTRPIKTVLSFRAFHSDTGAAHEDSSVRYLQVKFHIWHPEDEDVTEFLRIVTTKHLQPILVHCQHGSDRTGVMFAIYRIAVQGWSKEDALKEMRYGGYGFHPLWRHLTHYVKELDVDALKAKAEKEGPWTESRHVSLESR